MEIFPRGIMAEMRTEQQFVYNYHIVLLELSFHTLKQVNNWEKTQTFTLGNEDKIMRPWNDQVDEMEVQPIESEVTDIKQFPWNAFRVKEFTKKVKIKKWICTN